MMLTDGFAVALLSEGRLQIHDIADASVQGQSKFTLVLPPSSKEDVINSAWLTDNFLVYGTENGDVLYYLCDSWSPVHEYKHAVLLTIV